MKGTSPIMKVGILLLIIILLSVNLFNTTALSQRFDVKRTSWENYLIVGDALRIEFFWNELPKIKEDYKLEALHNTVQAWIDYREWMEYPQEWDVTIARLIKVGHESGLPIGVTFGYHVGDSVTAPYNDNVGFLYYYRKIIPIDDKWRYPNGTIANDPYSVGSSRSFSGYYVVRILGSPSDIKMLKRLDLYSTMQPQNPYWKKFFLEWGKNAIDKGADSFFIDSPDAIFTFFWGGGWGCSDTWEGLGLINHLKNKFSEKQLKSLGIKDVEKFCLRNYLIEKYGRPKLYANPYVFREKFLTSWPYETIYFPDVKRILQDPVMKEALVYWYTSAIKFVRDVSKEFKEYAQDNGREILLTSNHYFAWIPHITLAPYMDAIYVETNQFKPPPYNTRPVVCKLAMASVNNSKPVWIGEWLLNFANPFEPNSPPRTISNLIKIRIAESYASRCIMLVPFGTGSPDEGWPPRRLIVGEERDEVSKYYRFIWDNRELFKDTESMANVALIVSVPTAVWGFLPALGVFEADDYQKEIFGWARVLESLGIPYDVLLLGMDNILMTDSPERFKKYDLIIAPHLTHVSDGHLRKILDYVQSGGRLIATNDLGMYDEYNNLRNDRKIVKSILQRPNVKLTKVWLGRDYMNSLGNLSPDPQLFEEMAKVIEEQLKGIKMISIEAPPTIYVNILSQRSSGRILIHLVNYDYAYDESRDYVEPTGPLNITLRLPKLYQVERVSAVSPDTNQIISLKYSVEDGELHMTVPKIDVWDIIIVEPSKRTIIQTTTIMKTLWTSKTLERTKEITRTTTEVIMKTLFKERYFTSTLTTTATIQRIIEQPLNKLALIVGVLLFIIGYITSILIHRTKIKNFTSLPQKEDE